MEEDQKRLADALEELKDHNFMKIHESAWKFMYYNLPLRGLAFIHESHQTGHWSWLCCWCHWVSSNYLYTNIEVLLNLSFIPIIFLEIGL